MAETSDNVDLKTCRAVILTSFGGYEKLTLQQVLKPCPDDRNVVVKIEACGMNFSDLYTRQGIYTFHGRKPPFILGLEGAGIIFKTGSNVSEYKVKDRVLCWSFNYGIWSEYVELPTYQCFPIPQNMTYLEAASIVINYVTAYLTIVDFGNLRSGQSVLIQSAAGGVGWAATQIAKSVADVTIFGTASPEKHNAIKENGVTHSINYLATDFVEEVLKVSSSGVNLILDCLSGTDFTRAQKCLKHMGRLVHIGISSMISGEKRSLIRNLKVWWQTKDIGISNLINRNQAVCGINIASLFEEDQEVFRHALTEVLKLFANGKIKPRIDSIWSFDEVIEATKHMVERKNTGKLILVPKKESTEAKEKSSSN